MTSFGAEPSLTTLGHLVKSHWSGYSFKSNDYSDAGVPVLTKGDIKPRGQVKHGGKFVPAQLVEKNRVRLTQKDDLLVSTRDLTTAANFLGLVARAPNTPHAVNQGVTVFKVRSDLVDAAYLAYWCESPTFRGHIKGHYAGATQIHIRHSDLMAAPVLLPDFGRQHRIASVLSAYDDLIENNTRRIAILEEMARRIYEEWFVHFRFPGHEQVRMVKSDLGLIPREWALVKLGEVVELAYGKALKAEERKSGMCPVYGSSGVVGFHDQYLVGGPGIIVGRKGNVGSVYWCYLPFYPIDTVYFVRTKLPLHYVFFNLKRQNFLNNDAAVPGLNRNQAYGLQFLVPSEAVLNRFVEICVPIFEQVRVLTAKNTNLCAARDLLLPKLISGEIDVSTLPEPKEAIAA